MDFSLRQNKRCIECGDSGPDKDSRFRCISLKSARFIKNSPLTISGDVKKKVGNFENNDAEYRSKGMPRLVNDHDFLRHKSALILDLLR